MSRPEGEEPSDESLMALVQADDSIAFAELYRRHVDRAFRVARAVGLDARGAEDAIDSGFAAVWRRRADFRPEVGSFRAWLMTTVQNQARDSLRGSAGGGGELGSLPEPLAEIVILALHGEVDRREISSHLVLSEPPTEGRMRLSTEVRFPAQGATGRDA